MIAISVDGIGRPIEPLNSADTGLMHAAGDVSVRPHACVSGLPGHFLPALGDGCLHGHAAAERHLQLTEIDTLETRRVAAAR